MACSVGIMHPLCLQATALPPCNSFEGGPSRAPRLSQGLHKPTPYTSPGAGRPDPWVAASAPGWRRRVSRAALRDRSSCCLWSVLSKQYLRSSTAGRESGKSAEAHQALPTHASTHALCTQVRTQVGRAPRLSSRTSVQQHCGTPAGAPDHPCTLLSPQPPMVQKDSAGT